MADTTANRGYTFPESTDDVRVHEDIQALAEDVDADVDTIVNRPVGRAIQAVAQSSIASGTLTAATLTTEDFDTHNFHSTSSNTSRVTPTVPGRYRAIGAVAFGGTTNYESLEVLIRKNGSTALPPATKISGVTTSDNSNATQVVPVSALVECNGSGDYFEICFRGNRTSGTVATVISSQYATVLEWEYIGPL